MITQISCGQSHSMAVNEWGQVYTWGSNACYQLGYDTTGLVEPAPKLLKTLATKHVVQIASGNFHSLALTNGRI